MVSHPPAGFPAEEYASPATVHTIGVAIAVPTPFGSELQNWRSAFGDPMAELIPPHITLLPPTEVGADELPRIIEHLGDVAAEVSPFRVHLRGTATFRPVSPVVFVAVSRGISDCETLSKSVRTGPLPVDLRFPYHPHVTVAHNLTDDELDHAFETLSEYEATFQVDAFGLYEHGPNGVWMERLSFPLTDDPACPGTP